MENRAKSGILVTAVITATLLILLNVFVFAIPFEKLSISSHFINYGIATFVLIAQGVIFGITIFGEKNAKQRVMGLPIIYSCFVTLGLQILVSTLFFIINANVELASWIVVVVEAIVIAYMVISVARGFFYKKHSEAIQEKDLDTVFMNEFKARVQAACAINHIDGVSHELEDLYDVARGSDPVTNERTADLEEKLLLLVQELSKSIKEGNEDDTRDVIGRTKDLLLERNALCKVGKHG